MRRGKLAIQFRKALILLEPVDQCVNRRTLTGNRTIDAFAREQQRTLDLPFFQERQQPVSERHIIRQSNKTVHRTHNKRIHKDSFINALSSALTAIRIVNPMREIQGGHSKHFRSQRESVREPNKHKILNSSNKIFFVLTQTAALFPKQRPGLMCRNIKPELHTENDPFTPEKSPATLLHTTGYGVILSYKTTRCSVFP